MQLKEQINFRENPKEYYHLKEHSYYFKELNRGTIDYKTFTNIMKEVYKTRTTDKLNTIVENIDLINSVFDVLK